MPTYLRLRSLTTGHQWDACETAAAAYLATGGVEIVSRYPPRTASRPRSAKHLRTLAGLPARPRRRRAPGQPTTEE
jgi:hypothetical protein